MHCFRLLFVALGFAFVSQALPQFPRSDVAGERSVAAANAIPTEDFLLSHFNETSVRDATTGSWNRSLSFVFADPNSNTSTTCSATWTETVNSTTAPSQYIVCTRDNGSAKEEFFDWYFTSYTDPCQFSLQLAHEFSDPKYFAPPYDYVEFFAPVNVTLECNDIAGTYCKLPRGKSTLHAIINNISN